jgi:hypothetical protein
MTCVCTRRTSNDLVNCSNANNYVGCLEQAPSFTHGVAIYVARCFVQQVQEA